MTTLTVSTIPTAPRLEKRGDITRMTLDGQNARYRIVRVHTNPRTGVRKFWLALVSDTETEKQ